MLQQMRRHVIRDLKTVQNCTTLGGRENPFERQRLCLDAQGLFSKIDLSIHSKY